MYRHCHPLKPVNINHLYTKRTEHTILGCCDRNWCWDCNSSIKRILPGVSTINQGRKSRNQQQRRETLGWPHGGEKIAKHITYV
jgi:hypothetical protein